MSLLRGLITVAALSSVRCSSVAHHEELVTCSTPVHVLVQRATTSDVLYNIAYKWAHHSKIESWSYQVLSPDEANALLLTREHRQLGLDPAKQCVRTWFQVHVQLPHFLDGYISATAPLDVENTVCSSGNRVFDHTEVHHVPILGKLSMEGECSLYTGGMRCVHATRLDVPVLMSMLSSHLADVCRQSWHDKDTFTALQLCAA